MNPYALTRNSLFPVLAAALLMIPHTVSAADGSQGFDKVLKQDGITFHVTCPNEGSLNDVTIVPSGLAGSNDPITIKEADGSVSGADAADINKDGSPEIYVYVNSAGSGSYGSLIAYSANHKKSMSEIYLSPLEDDKVNSKGYMGHDRFSIKDNHLVRSFPVYKDGDSNANPTGGTRQLEYKLVQGEAAWQLKLVNSSIQ
jgi:hypothetical protein